MSNVVDGKQLTFGSLFTGLGGLDLGLERAGLRCAFQVEIEDYPTKVLQRHWPDVPKFRDVRQVGSHNLPRVDILAGGFPCQDISNSGKKKGIEGERSGLWGEYARLIRELRPSYIVVENVAALLHRQRGFQRVLGDLAEVGYDAFWDVLPAASFGAPHIRERVFVVAYARSLGGHDGIPTQLFKPITPQGDPQWTPGLPMASLTSNQRTYRSFPEHLRVGDGVPFGMERLKGCGNAVVPAVGEHVGRCLLEFHQQVFICQAA